MRMKWLDKILETNLNAILVTVIIHLFVLFAFLLVQLKPPPQQEEAIIIMDPENLEEMERFFEAEEAIEERMKELAEAQNMSLEDIRNLATNSRVPENQNWDNEDQRLSAEELKQQYEDALRKEMYGDEYDEINEKLNETAERQEYDFSPNADDTQKKGIKIITQVQLLLKLNWKIKTEDMCILKFPCLFAVDQELPLSKSKSMNMDKLIKQN